VTAGTKLFGKDYSLARSTVLELPGIFVDGKSHFRNIGDAGRECYAGRIVRAAAGNFGGTQ
jgi:hypothetical protein